MADLANLPQLGFQPQSRGPVTASTCYTTSRLLPSPALSVSESQQVNQLNQKLLSFAVIFNCPPSSIHTSAHANELLKMSPHHHHRHYEEDQYSDRDPSPYRGQYQQQYRQQEPPPDQMYQQQRALPNQGMYQQPYQQGPPPNQQMYQQPYQQPYQQGPPPPAQMYQQPFQQGIPR